MKNCNRNCWIKQYNTSVPSCLVLGTLANSRNDLQVDNCTYISTLNIGWSAVDRHVTGKNVFSIPQECPFFVADSKICIDIEL
jgi:hypothetical protein